MFKTKIKGFKVFDKDGNLVRFYRGTRTKTKQELNRLSDRDYFKKKFPSYSFDGDLRFELYKNTIDKNNVDSYINQNNIKEQKYIRLQKYNNLMLKSLIRKVKKIVIEYNNKVFDNMFKVTDKINIETDIDYSKKSLFLKVTIDNSKPKKFTFDLDVDRYETREQNKKKLKLARDYLKHVL